MKIKSVEPDGEKLNELVQAMLVAVAPLTSTKGEAAPPPEEQAHIVYATLVLGTSLATEGLMSREMFLKLAGEVWDGMAITTEIVHASNAPGAEGGATS